MSTPYIRFGAEPSASQEVSKELKDRNINLLRKDPASVQVSGGATTIQPNFAIYKSFLPAFMYSAMSKEEVKAGTSVYRGLNTGSNPVILPIPFPDLVISWNVTVAEEVRDEMRGKGWVDTVTRGKPAMFKSYPTKEDAVYARSKSCLTTTPAGENSMNLNSFRHALVLCNILAVFLKTHQYPAFVDDDHESEFNKRMEEKIPTAPAPAVAAEDAIGGDDTMDTVDDAEFTRKRYRVNLPEDPHTRPIFHDEGSMPIGSGLLFQFVEELCKFDRTTVPTVINRFFLGCLDDEEEGAIEAFSEFVRAWGVLHNSKWADAMSHIFKVIEIALVCQCEVKVMITAGRYDGIFMHGAGFRVRINGAEYVAASASEIKENLRHLDYHANALWSIMRKIPFIDDDSRKNAFRITKSMKQLKGYLDALSVGGGIDQRDAVMKEAKFLAFPEDRALDSTAANIAYVLSFIADSAKDLNLLPSMHYSVLFSSNRAHVAWSAFGEEAPSFQVPGGKVMMLNAHFKVTSAKMRQEKGPAAHRDVSKIGATIVPLTLALTHLDKTLADKSVCNPFGNVVVNAAASHMNKIFEGDSCTMIVEAWRKACKVTVVDTGRGKKRGGDDDEIRPQKKGRFDVGF